MICLEGTGTLSKFSLRHHSELTNEPKVFAAVSVLGSQPKALVLEGRCALEITSAVWGRRIGRLRTSLCWGLPRHREATFEARFPFATVRLRDDRMPLETELTGWSPFCPRDADNASLPVAGIEYRFTNRSGVPVIPCSHSRRNFMAPRHRRSIRTQSPVTASGSTGVSAVRIRVPRIDRGMKDIFAAW